MSSSAGANGCPKEHRANNFDARSSIHPRVIYEQFIVSQEHYFDASGAPMPSM
jgi:hypothetical protein